MYDIYVVKVICKLSDQNILILYISTSQKHLTKTSSDMNAT